MAFGYTFPLPQRIGFCGVRAPRAGSYAQSSDFGRNSKDTGELRVASTTAIQSEGEPSIDQLVSELRQARLASVAWHEEIRRETDAYCKGLRNLARVPETNGQGPAET